MNTVLRTLLRTITFNDERQDGREKRAAQAHGDPGESEGEIGDGVMGVIPIGP